MAQDEFSTMMGWEGSDERCSISELKEYLQTPDLSSKEKPYGWGWVFWYPKIEEKPEYDFAQLVQQNSNVCEEDEREKIKSVLEALRYNYNDDYIVQFWGKKVVAGQLCLTTVGQPFALGCRSLRKAYCWYRKQCENHLYLVKEEATGEEVGSVGRAFLNMKVVYSPDLSLYSIQEFPLRNQAARSGLTRYLAMPVFDLHNNECYGVLEILSSYYSNASRIFSLLDQGLKEAGLRSTHIHSSPINFFNGSKPLKYTHQPESEIVNMMESAMEAVPQLQVPKFSSDWSQFSPWLDNFTPFLPMSLVVDVIEFPQGNKFTSSELDESYSSPFKFKIVHYGQKKPQHSIDELFDPHVMDSVPSVLQEKSSNAATFESREKGVAKEKPVRKRNGSLHIQLEDLEPHFGKKIEHAADALGVGRSTIKRACRFHGIDRWPDSEKYIQNPRLFEAAGTSHDFQHSHSTNLPPPYMSQPVTELQPEAEMVMVKAKYEDEIIKFKLCLSATMNKLQEEVAKRLDLEIGSFKLRYLDEDNDKILLSCDDDLQLCLKGLTAGDKTCVQVFVQLIRK